MFSHVFIGVTDFARAFAFYAPIMERLGYPLKFQELDVPWAAWMSPGADRPLLLIGRPFDGLPAGTGNGQMVALLAASRALVDQSYQDAIDAGGRDEGAPGLRPIYHPNYYGAYFRDPDGNKLCVCCHEPMPPA